MYSNQSKVSQLIVSTFQLNLLTCRVQRALTQCGLGDSNLNESGRSWSVVVIVRSLFSSPQAEINYARFNYLSNSLNYSWTTIMINIKKILTVKFFSVCLPFYFVIITLPPPPHTHTQKAKIKKNEKKCSLHSLLMITIW